MKTKNILIGDIAIRFADGLFVDFGDGVVATKFNPTIRVRNLKMYFQEQCVMLTINHRSRRLTYSEIVSVTHNGKTVYDVNQYV